MFYSVKWFEPLNTTRQEALGWAGLLPAGRGWHEQTCPNIDTAQQLESALRYKGFALVTMTPKRKENHDV